MVIRNWVFWMVVASSVEAFVDENPVNPAEEPVPRVVGVEPLIDLDERILCSIPGIFVIPQQPDGDAEQHPLIIADQLLEGSGVALETASNQRRVV